MYTNIKVEGDKEEELRRKKRRRKRRRRRSKRQSRRRRYREGVGVRAGAGGDTGG